MKILIDMGHPAHVHFFKNAIRELERLGHAVAVTARDKDVTLKLLEAYKIPYETRPDGWRPLNLFKAARFVTDAARAFGAERLVGVHNPYIARAASSLEKPCILFTDTPGSPFVNRISVAHATKVITPECLRGMFANQVTYPGCKEMAYLHPFAADRSVLARHGLRGRYYVVRFIGWTAHHDSGFRGLTSEGKDQLVKALSAKGQVVACNEDGIDIPEGCIPVQRPEDAHSLLALSSGYAGEGATMAKEAAVLGVPSVYLSPMDTLPPIIWMERAGALVRTMSPEGALKALEAPWKRVMVNDVLGAVVGGMLQ
jgi:predicted glycosyltransferase